LEFEVKNRKSEIKGKLKIMISLEGGNQTMLRSVIAGHLAMFVPEYQKCHVRLMGMHLHKVDLQCL
jgi:hypothetical protein